MAASIIPPRAYPLTATSSSAKPHPGFGGAYGQTAYRWIEAGGFEPLGSIEATPIRSQARPFPATARSSSAMSAQPAASFPSTEDDGMQSLGWLEGRDSYGNDKALAASYDGSVIVGSALSSTDKFQAFHWTESTGMVALPTLSASSAAKIPQPRPAFHGTEPSLPVIRDKDMQTRRFAGSMAKYSR